MMVMSSLHHTTLDSIPLHSYSHPYASFPSLFRLSSSYWLVPLIYIITSIRFLVCIGFSRLSRQQQQQQYTVVIDVVIVFFFAFCYFSFCISIRNNGQQIVTSTAAGAGAARLLIVVVSYGFFFCIFNRDTGYV